jgi:hypothetical protein
VVFFFSRKEAKAVVLLRRRLLAAEISTKAIGLVVFFSRTEATAFVVLRRRSELLQVMVKTILVGICSLEGVLCVYYSIPATGGPICRLWAVSATFWHCLKPRRANVFGSFFKKNKIICSLVNESGYIIQSIVS